MVLTSGREVPQHIGSRQRGEGVAIVLSGLLSFFSVQTGHGGMQRYPDGTYSGNQESGVPGVLQEVQMEM